MTNSDSLEPTPPGRTTGTTPQRRRPMAAAALAVLAVTAPSLGGSPAAAQVRAVVHATGFSRPVAVIQDPSDSQRQVVVEQGGRIRTISSGLVQPTDFLDLTSVVSSTGERGLLGLAFAPDYAASGRIFVSFTNLQGHTVVARFRRASGAGDVADPESRFDLRWPSGDRFIAQPFTNHNGGTLVFGPDGHLYIGLGDGGGSNDPGHRAQDPGTLLGKLLRIDVDVQDSDPEGYDVPADNPFLDGTPIPALGEIFAFGLRNPWKFAFDDPARGGTGALWIGDVGESAWEEINYQAAGVAGLNYGWRNREGAHDHVTGLAPAFGPLVDPIVEYDRSVGRSVTGGLVYRGAALGAGFQGRYLFADFVRGRVWSVALTTDPVTGDPAATDLVEHTAELGGSDALGLISAFGVDSQAEPYLVSWSRGEILRLVPDDPRVTIDLPASGQSVTQPFRLAGWAIDRRASTGTGIDAVDVWAYPTQTANLAPQFIGSATYGGARPDVGSAFGGRFAASGFDLTVTSLPPGPYRLVAFARSTVANAFAGTDEVEVTVRANPHLAIDIPQDGAALVPRFRVGGWAVDGAAGSGTGIDAVHVWAFPLSGGAPIFLGAAALGLARPDVGAIFGPAFAPSGFDLITQVVPSGSYTVTAFGRSTVTNAFAATQTVAITVASRIELVVDTPPSGATRTQPFPVAGWAADLAGATGSGIDAVHAWAYPVAGGPPQFVGVASYGFPRADVASQFGAQFVNSGYGLSVSGLAAGTWDLALFAHSSFTGTFSDARIVRVTVG